MSYLFQPHQQPTSQPPTSPQPFKRTLQTLSYLYAVIYCGQIDGCTRDELREPSSCFYEIQMERPQLVHTLSSVRKDKSNKGMVKG